MECDATKVKPVVPTDGSARANLGYSSDVDIFAISSDLTAVDG